MLDSQVLDRLAASPSAQATIVLVAVALIVQWYFNLPPNPKFPKAELDETDWHGSLMKAKSKVRRHDRYVCSSRVNLQFLAFQSGKKQ